MINSFNKVYLTDGASYFGSHTCVELLNVGMDLPVFVNFGKSHTLALAPEAQMTGKNRTMVQVNFIQEREAFEIALSPSGSSEFIDFVGLTSVGEPVQKPLADYENNVAGCLNLLQVF